MILLQVRCVLVVAGQEDGPRRDRLICLLSSSLPKTLLILVVCTRKKQQPEPGGSDPMAAETYVTDVPFGEDVITATVTSSGSAVEDWLGEVRSLYRRHLRGLVVGLDVEWRPSFGGGQNPVALLQLCVGRRCLIFQLLHADRIPVALAAFLADPDLRFVGVEADAERLSDDHGLEVVSTVDLRGLAAEGMDRPDLRQAGLQAVVCAVMDANLVKPQRVTMSRWDAYCLSGEQIQYACIDAFVSFEVGRRLLTGADYF